MADGRRRSFKRLNRSTQAFAAGFLLLLAGGLLLVLAGRDQGTPETAQRPEGAAPSRPGRTQPAKPCPRHNVQPGQGASRGTPFAPDQGSVTRPSTRRLAATALSVAAVGSGGMAPVADAHPVRARPADSLVKSEGVNVHLGYTQSPYRRYDVVQKKLQRLGVRHIRDGLNPGQPFVYEAWRTLAKCGIKLDLLVGDPLQRWGIGPLNSQLALIKREKITEAVASLEGPNEYDNQGDKNWAPVLRSYQRRLYEGVKSDPELKRFPVLGPTIVDADNRDVLGDISGSLDYGNMHPYPGGNAPDQDDHLQSEFALASKNSRSKPVQATETGYHNGVNSAAGHRPASERAAGVYMPRLFLDYFRRGIARTYSYELLDQHPDSDKSDLEAHFGLLRNDYSEKPAYTALRRMNSLLSDPGPSFTPSSLAFSVQGAPSGLRKVLLQKRDGTFYLAVWEADSVWNPDARKAVRASSNGLRVNFGRSMGRVEVYRPSDSGRALASHSNVRSMPIAASPSVSILKISPGPTTKGAAVPYRGLRGKERRVARRLVHLRGAHQSSVSGVERRVRRLSHWLAKRSHTIRRQARRHGWAPENRRVRYRAIRTVLRRA